MPIRPPDRNRYRFACADQKGAIDMLSLPPNPYFVFCLSDNIFPSRVPTRPLLRSHGQTRTIRSIHRKARSHRHISKRIDRFAPCAGIRRHRYIGHNFHSALPFKSPFDISHGVRFCQPSCRYRKLNETGDAIADTLPDIGDISSNRHVSEWRHFCLPPFGGGQCLHGTEKETS